MQYESPTSTREAVALLAKAKGNVHLLAGGTDLLVRIRSDFIDPDLVVDIKRIPVVQESKRRLQDSASAPQCPARTSAITKHLTEPGRVSSKRRS